MNQATIRPQVNRNYSKDILRRQEDEVGMKRAKERRLSTASSFSIYSIQASREICVLERLFF